jgi:hypothetical protein
VHVEGQRPRRLPENSAADIERAAGFEPWPRLPPLRAGRADDELEGLREPLLLPPRRRPSLSPPR